MENQVRPKPVMMQDGVVVDKQRINHREQFELCYLRWRYFMKSPNPPEELMKKYEPLVKKISVQYYGRFRPIFRAAGFEVEDVTSVGRVQLVSYLGLFSLRHNKDKNEEFFKDFFQTHGREPTAKELDSKDLSHMIEFISQRFMDLSRVCSLKNRSVIGEQTYCMFLKVGKEKECSDSDLLMYPERYGFKKITAEEVRQVRRLVKHKLNDSERFKVGRKVYRLVHITYPVINVEGLTECDSLINDMGYQQDSIEAQDSFADRTHLEVMTERLEKMPKNKKKLVLKRIIEVLEASPGNKAEIKLANDMLAKLR